MYSDFLCHTSKISFLFLRRLYSDNIMLTSSAVQAPDKDANAACAVLAAYLTSDECQLIEERRTHYAPRALRLMISQRGHVQTVLSTLRQWQQEGRRYRTVAELLAALMVVKRASTTMSEPPVDDVDPEATEIYRYADGASWNTSVVCTRPYGLPHLSQIDWPRFVQKHRNELHEFTMNGTVYYHWFDSCCCITLSTIGDHLLVQWATDSSSTSTATTTAHEFEQHLRRRVTELHSHRIDCLTA